MSFKERLRAIFLCAALELGLLSGVPMRPEEIRTLMNQMNRPKLAHVLPSEEESGDDPPEDDRPPVPLHHESGGSCAVAEGTTRPPPAGEIAAARADPAPSWCEREFYGV